MDSDFFLFLAIYFLIKDKKNQGVRCIVKSHQQERGRERKVETRQRRGKRKKKENKI
jgi:hypothetical protein